MLNVEDKQFSLQGDGHILFQADPTNPLPGAAFAFLQKGDSILKPKVNFLEDHVFSGQDPAALRLHVEAWLGRHIAATLEPLVALENDETLQGSAKGIAFQVYEALGIVPREQLEDLIAGLDQETRRHLRAKHIRLGPILVFIPALNKPAAVRLRALLWGLYNDKTLPMECPKDGIVSFAVDPHTVDRNFYQSVGYPVFGGRAIRIDMLDRVISAVYDTAKDGQFQAQHQMAEWLGSTIEGLYEVLEAMGHRKIHDPAAVQAAAETPAEAPTEPPSETKDPAVKPELATFRLKKGKAFAQGAPKKPAKSDKKPKHKSKKSPEKKPRDDQPKIISAGPKPKLEDSPFAVLEQLKKNAKN